MHLFEEYYLCSVKFYIILMLLCHVLTRRTLRKCPYSYEVYISLAALSKVFRKHGFLLNAKSTRIIYDNFRVAPETLNLSIYNDILRKSNTEIDSNASTAGSTRSP